MTNLRQAAEMALKVLEEINEISKAPMSLPLPAEIDDAMETLRQALSQPQREWVGLTDQEMSDTVADIDVNFGDLLWKVVCLTKIIEAKLKEKNT